MNQPATPDPAGRKAGGSSSSGGGSGGVGGVLAEDRDPVTDKSRPSRRVFRSSDVPPPSGADAVRPGNGIYKPEPAPPGRHGCSRLQNWSTAGDGAGQVEYTALILRPQKHRSSVKKLIKRYRIRNETNETSNPEGRSYQYLSLSVGKCGLCRNGNRFARVNS